MRFVIVSGRSGSGKSSALNMLEDLGYYCVDNLPAGLMPELARQALKEHSATASNEAKPVAIGIDARNIASDLRQFAELVQKIPASVDVSIVFLDASDATLIKRFSETRRKHPLSSEKISLSEALAAESQSLESIAGLADLTIDTSAMNLHQLRQLIRERIAGKTQAGLSLLFQSFGFKGNLPIDSDLVFDVRCLPNPYWQTELREHSGRDKPVVDFLGAQPEVLQMYQDIESFVSHWLPHFQSGNRSYLTVSIGCTGGKHRSVYLAERLQQHFSQSLEQVQVRHRDLDQNEGNG